MTLVCEATGSSSTRFTWYKDGALIDFGRTSRHMWLNRITKDGGEHHISELNIEKPQRLDEGGYAWSWNPGHSCNKQVYQNSDCPVLSGDYSCKVTDWDQTEVRTVHVHVIPVPHMEVTPKTASMNLDSSLAITCISRDDEFATFEYSWKRNGKTLMPGPNGEIVEQLLPTGSRLSIPALKQSAMYSCTITSQAGSMEDYTEISLLRGEQLCQASPKYPCHQYMY